VSKTVDILVIDDEQVVREGVCRVCEAAGLSIESAGDAASGLEKLEKCNYRLVLCDVMLPEHDGFHVLHAIRQMGLKTPVIMITGCSTLQNAVNALKDGAIDFIPKPFTVDELESGIQRGLSYHKLMEQALSTGSTGGKGAILSPACPRECHRLGGLSWVKIEHNGVGLLGVTDLFMKTISDVKGLTFLDINRDLVQASSCATLTSGDALVHEVLSPLSGTIITRNEQLLSHPELLGKDPYSSGWLYQVVPTNLAYELGNLVPCSQDY
jgi:DNA-binding response OmpR family regulator